VHLERSLVYDGPWRQLEGDTPEEWEILEQLAARGIRTSEPDVLAERLRLEALRETWTRTGRAGDG
jgi:hypothetical protein